MSPEHDVQQALEDWAAHRSAPDPTPMEARALVARARQQHLPAWRRPPVRIAWTMAAMAAAIALFFVMRPPTTAPEPVPLVQRPTPAPPTPVPEPTPPPPAWLPVGTNPIGDDTLVVAEGAQVRVVEDGPETTLALASGTVEAQVAHRDPGEQFSIDAGDYEVAVIGTRFTVSREPFSVSVEEGVVEVRQALGDGRWRIRAGERFAQGQIIRPPPPPVRPPSLVDLRQQVRDGDLEAAREGLSTRLEADPADVEGWELLARLEQKAGAPERAAQAWRAVIDQGDGRRASRARYELAILSDDPVEVEQLMRAFLPDAGPLAADARLRLARALLAQGRTPEAQAELQTIVQEHPGSAPAAAAQALLAP